MKRVVAVGIAVLDRIFEVDRIPAEPVKVAAKSYREIGGGPAATGSAAIARLGGRAVLFARVGDDATGRRIAEELAEWGVEPHVRPVPGGRSSVSSVAVDAAGERLIISFFDPDLDPDPSWLPRDVVAGADAVLADSRWPAGAAAVLAEARRRGVPSVLDADLAGEGAVDALAPLADHVVFARPALARYAGTDDAAEGLRRARTRLAGVLAVTLAQDGVLWLDGEAVRRVPAPAVSVVDTLGAGDVFHGAYALAIAEGRPVPQAIGFANAAAALKCTRPGGRAGIPSRAEVEALLRAAGGG